MVPLGYKVVLRVVKDKAKENDKEKGQKEISEDGAENGQAMKEKEEINGCKKCKGRWRSTSSVQFTDGQSGDHSVYSWGFIYIATVCTYCMWLDQQVNKSIIGKWSIRHWSVRHGLDAYDVIPGLCTPSALMTSFHS